MLDQLTFDLTKLENKARFVTSIINGSLVVQNRKKSILLKELALANYVPISKKKLAKESTEEEQEEDTDSVSDHGYDYLLSMPIWNLTAEKVKFLELTNVFIL